MHGHYEKRKQKKGKKIALIVFLVLLILLLTVAVVGVVVYNNTLNLVSRAEIIEKDNTVDPAMLGIMEETEAAMPEETVEATTEPTTVPTTLPYTPFGQDIINILVVGQASRKGEETRLSDTMILATINKTTKVITLTSFPRDTYVDMPDYMGHTCGWNRINVVYNLGWQWGDTGGAMEMMNMCLKNNFGIEVDYDVEIDFKAFVKVIDILGGVRIDLTEAEVEYLNEHKYDYQEDLTAGENRLFGDHALSYARMRKAEGDSDSDIKRTERQRKLITALIKKLMTKGFGTIQQLAEEVLPMITTNMTNDEITTCLWEIAPLLPEMTIESGTCPVQGTYWGEVIDLFGYESSVLKFDAGQNKKLMMPITEGIPQETTAP